MPAVTKVSAQTFNQTSQGKKRGRPIGSKNKTTRAKEVNELPSYTWECACGKKQIMHIRCYWITCKCGKSMTCTRKAGVL